VAPRRPSARVPQDLELKEDGASGTDHGLERKELEKAIEKSLASLEEPLREVFILSRYHEMKYSEIATMLGISVKTVEARLSRALQDLQKLLKDFL
jgi:RNA polymerase sigma-70 factor (ECF subfamily)